LSYSPRFHTPVWYRRGTRVGGESVTEEYESQLIEVLKLINDNLAAIVYNTAAIDKTLGHWLPTLGPHNTAD
jgi:hypothetical protein